MKRKSRGKDMNTMKNKSIRRSKLCKEIVYLLSFYSELHAVMFNIKLKQITLELYTAFKIHLIFKKKIVFAFVLYKLR